MTWGGVLEDAVRLAGNVAVADRLVPGSGALADPGADAHPVPGAKPTLEVDAPEVIGLGSTGLLTVPCSSGLRITRCMFPWLPPLSEDVLPQA